MSHPRVIIVHLRRPRRNDPQESRGDPFYELGSFGCTRCHSRNLMNPKRASTLNGARFAFAQGGKLGFRLIHLTPPVCIVPHLDRCEATWKPVRMPFRYAAAPVLVAPNGKTDFPKLMEMLGGVNRTTFPARFSSKFRSCRRDLPADVAQELCRVFDRLRRKAGRGEIAQTYVDSLPYSPNKPDLHRRATLKRLRAEAKKPPSTRKNGCRRISCRPPKNQPSCTGDPTLGERLRGLAAFLPVFEKPGFTFGSWSEIKESKPGSIVMPFFSLSHGAASFIKAAYDLGWVRGDVDWVTWKQTPEAKRLADDAGALENATPEQLARLLTVLIRQERFCEGSLACEYKSGLLPAILRRAVALASEFAARGKRT